MLEQNISAKLGILHTREAQRSMNTWTTLAMQHLPELGTHDAAVLTETTLLATMIASNARQPPLA